MEVQLTWKLGEDGERQPAPAGFLGVLINWSKAIQKNDFVRSQLV